jgi:predicted DNA-binding ribbon-helix-helix protein
MKKRSIIVAGHKTSVSLEDAFWEGFKEIARGRNTTLSELVAAVDSERQQSNLSSAIRLFVLDFYRNKLADVQAGGDGPGGNLAIRAEAVMPSGHAIYLHPKDGRHKQEGRGQVALFLF